MKLDYLVVGGGSGGHLTPLIAVADALKKIDAASSIGYVGQKGENLNDVVRHPSIDLHYSISAGKFRRYNGESVWQHIRDVRTIALNVRDFFRFVLGTLQSVYLLFRIRPRVIFLKGGFVSVPVGFAARVLRIPYVTHDSDAIPGLANRLTASHATYNLTALPVENYPYNLKKAVQVGIPLQPQFSYVDENKKRDAKQVLGIDPNSQVLFCVGGGLGAQRLNDALIEAMPMIIKKVPKLLVFHITGKKLYAGVIGSYQKHLGDDFAQTVQCIDFTTELYKYSAAADLVVTRAGATNMAEFAMQAKPCIVVPSPFLTGGQQLHNAKIYEKARAAVVIQEDSIGKLGETIAVLLQPDKQLERNELGEALHTLSGKGASEKIAELLVGIAKG